MTVTRCSEPTCAGTWRWPTGSAAGSATPSAAWLPAAGLQAAGEGYLAVLGCNNLGHVQIAQGRLDAALGTYQMALEITARPGASRRPRASRS